MTWTPEPPPARRRTWVLALAGAVAGVAVLAVVAALALAGGRPTAASPAGPGAGAPRPQPGQWQALSAQHNALATWNYAGTFIVAADTQVTAYDSHTGRIRWQTKAPAVPAGRTAFCGASRTISGSTAALGLGILTDATGTAIDCHSVAALNVATGHLGWAQSIPDPAQSAQYGSANKGAAALLQKGVILAVSGPHVVAGWLGVIAGFSLTSGTREWSAVVGPTAELDSHAPDFAGNVIRDIAILGPDVDVPVTGLFPDVLQLVRLDLATGRRVGAATLPDTLIKLTSPLGAQVISTAPLTVAVHQVVPTDAVSVVVLGPALHVTRVISAGSQLSGQGAVIGRTLNASAIAGNPDTQEYYPLVMSDGLLVGATLAPGRGGGNPLVAIDARTGRTRWAVAVRGADIIYPIAVTGPDVEVAGVSQGGQGNPILIKVSLATGRVLSVGRPRILGAAPLADTLQYYRFAAAGPAVYGVNWTVTQAARGALPEVFSLGR
jgi:outer membrane protein assembly factor BamB